MKARPPSQKRLSIDEIKHMGYLSKVRTVGFKLIINMLHVSLHYRYTSKDIIPLAL